MNPQEFPWTEDQQVTVVNPTKETFRWKVHNKEYELAGGAKARMPGYIAWLYVYNQGVNYAQRQKTFNRWNEDEYRKKCFEQFVVGAEQLVQTVTVEPQPVLELVEDAPKSPAKA